MEKHLDLTQRLHIEAVLNDLLNYKVRLVSHQLYAHHFATRNCFNEVEKVSGVPIITKDSVDNLEQTKLNIFQALLAYLKEYDYYLLGETDINRYQTTITRKTARLDREKEEEIEFKNGGSAPDYNLKLYDKKIPYLDNRSLKQLKYVYAVALIQQFKSGEPIQQVYIDTIFDIGTKEKG